MEGIVRDLRHALRSLLRAPGFTLTAVLVLALGIGLATAVFTIADAIVIRRLPVANQGRLLLLSGEARSGREAEVPLSVRDVRTLQRTSRTLAGIAFYEFRGAVPAPIQAGDRVYPVQLGMVSGNYFDVLGSRAVLGRALRPEDDVAGADPVVVLSYRAWQKRFGGDPGVLRRSLTMIYSGRSYRIVGVMPPGLDYPRGTDVWVPLVAYGAAGGFLDMLTREVDGLGRLRPGATRAQARGELTSYFARPGAPASQRDVHGTARTFADVVLGPTGSAVLLVALAAALLLFLTCVNVANLLLVRSLTRAHELAVRSALGASPGRLLAQLVAECALLAVAGGALGAALAAAGVRGFMAFAPATIPRVGEIRVGGGMLGAAVLLTAVALLLSGAAPAILARRGDAADVLRSGARHTSGRHPRALAESLVVAQIAVATVTLCAAALVGRSFMRFERVNLAFEGGDLLVVPLLMRPERLATAQSQRAALKRAISNIQALRGVRAVTPVFAPPLVGAGGGVDGRISMPEEGEEEQARHPIANLEVAAPNYFAMLGIAMLRGRGFTESDRAGSSPVVVVSRSIATHFWADADPLGKTLRGAGHDWRVVGVVPDTRYRDLRTPRPTVYFPLDQSPLPTPGTLLVRAPAALLPAVRRAVSEADPGLAVIDAAPFDALLDSPRAEPRLEAVVLALFGLGAVSVAAVGLFAIMATMVRQRTRELGIRLALGATAGRVGRSILLRGLALAAAGAAIGVGATLTGGRVLGALLFETSPTDSGTLALVIGVMLAVAALAAFLPARLSMRASPLEVLHSEG